MLERAWIVSVRCTEQFASYLHGLFVASVWGVNVEVGQVKPMCSAPVSAGQGPEAVMRFFEGVEGG